MVRFLQKPSYVMPFFENFESLFLITSGIFKIMITPDLGTIETYDNDEVNTSALQIYMDITQENKRGIDRSKYLHRF